MKHEHKQLLSALQAFFGILTMILGLYTLIIGLFIPLIGIEKTNIWCVWAAIPSGLLACICCYLATKMYDMKNED